MTITIPMETEANLLSIANARSVSIEFLVQEIIANYLSDDAALADELAAWQEIGDEAIEIVEQGL